MADSEQTSGAKPLPPPWDRIFSLGSRVFVWFLLFGILYILRPFFLLVFMTFVVAYILEHGVQGLRHRIKNRPIRVVLVSAVFLSALVTIGLALAPAFTDQARKLSREYTTYLDSIDAEIAKSRANYTWAKNMVPEDLRAADVLEYVLGFVENDDAPAGEFVVPPPRHRPGATSEEETAPPDDEERSDNDEKEAKEEPREDAQGAPVPEQQEPTTPDPELAAAALPRSSSKEKLISAIETLKNIASPILGIGSAFLLSLLFAFLIVLDLPKLSRGVAGLADTKIGFIYDEVAGNIRDLGKMLGRALEAQLFIAICNTILTAIGLFFLDLTTNLVFLSTIVFFCSFIPVAGVFLSSIPICLEALSDTGVQLMLVAVGMILIIHFIEAYFLNPRIFGHHLHMNAVLVLIVLTISGKLFGVWGLILGLPCVNYVFGHAIRRRDAKPSPTKSAAA